MQFNHVAFSYCTKPTMKFVTILALSLFCQSLVFARMARRHDDVKSVGAVVKAQNQVIEELKKQMDDMKAMMKEQTLKFEKKFAVQEEKLARQEEEIASLKRDTMEQLNDVTHIAKNAIVAENGKKMSLAFYLKKK